MIDIKQNNRNNSNYNSNQIINNNGFYTIQQEHGFNLGNEENNRNSNYSNNNYNNEIQYFPGNVLYGKNERNSQQLGNMHRVQENSNTLNTLNRESYNNQGLQEIQSNNSNPELNSNSNQFNSHINSNHTNSNPLTTSQNNHLQFQLKQSLKDMYVKHIHDNMKRKEDEKQKRIREEREIIEKVNELRKSEDLKHKYEQQVMKKMLFKDYVSANNLGQFYQNKQEETMKPEFGTSGLRFIQSMKPRRQNELNLSNKIVRDYYKENQELYSNSPNFFNKQNKNDDFNYKKHGKKMTNFVDMSLYFNDLKFNQLNLRDKEKEYLQTIQNEGGISGQGQGRVMENSIKHSPYYKREKVVERGINTLPDIYLGESTLRQNPITNPVNYFDESRYKNYLNFISK